MIKSLIKKKSSMVAIALALTLAIAASLWFSVPTKAVYFTFSPSHPSGTVSRSMHFSVTMDITNDDILPIAQLILVIGDDKPPADMSYQDAFVGLPIPSAPNTTTPTITMATVNPPYHTATVSTTSGRAWGSGTRSGRKAYGYGYTLPTGPWLDWGYHTLDTDFCYGYNNVATSYIGITSLTLNITWTPPSDWPAGTYYITAGFLGDNDKVIFDSTTFTLSARARAAPAAEPGVTDVSDIVGEDGVFTEAVTAGSEDGNVSLTIGEGTAGLTAEGEPISEISILEMEEADIPPPPEEGHVIGLAYDFGPDDATFDEPITISFTYDPDDLPEGVSEEDLVIAVWDEDAGEWIELPSVVDTVNHTVTATVDHFTAFAIVVLPVEEEEEVPPVVEEEEEVPPVVEEEEEVPPVVEEEEEVPPVVEEEEEPPVGEEEEEEITPPELEEKEGVAWWLWLIVGLASAAVVGLLVYFLWWRRRLA